MNTAASPWKRWLVRSGLAVVLVAVGCGRAPTKEITREIQSRVEAGSAVPANFHGAEEHLAEAMRRFYEGRAFRPAWIRADGWRGEAAELAEILESARDEGLDPLAYGGDSLRHRLDSLAPGVTAETTPDPAAWADLELRLTAGYLRYADHLMNGTVPPSKIYSEFHDTLRDRDLALTLDEALRSGRTRESLDDMRPPHEGYDRLREAMIRHRAIAEAGGWPTIPTDKELEKGQWGSAILALRDRLHAAGDLADTSGVHAFDERVEEALRRFQERHGLEPTGTVGEETRRWLDEPVEKAIERIALNLERWRWLPEELGARHVEVNVPGFEVELIENGEVVHRQDVIVGKTYSPTPIFSDEFTYVVVNPYWNVPQSIAVGEIAPAAAKNPSGYFASRNMEVRTGWDEDAQAIDPASVDWSAAAQGDFPYRIRRRPGPGNPLGLIKFMCPNQNNVYLHDTPSEHLFDKEERDFSHGCIRLEQPWEFGRVLLEDDPEASYDAVEAARASGRRTVLSLGRPVPVHILYWTAWVDGEAVLHLRDDLYGHDERLAKALEKALSPLALRRVEAAGSP